MSAQAIAEAESLRRGGTLTAAITYVLNRADREPEGLGLYLEPATEAWARLVDAEAQGLGRDPRRHRIHRLGGVQAKVLAAWEAYERGERATVLARFEDGSTLVEPLGRADVWVVHRAPEGAPRPYSLTHGPSGMRGAGGDDDAALLNLAMKLAEAAPGLLEVDPYGPEAEAYGRLVAVLREAT